MTSKNPRITEIEEMQERIRKRAEEARKDGEYILFTLLKKTTELLEDGKLFVSPPKLLSAYRDILRKTAIEIGGMSWPVSSIITATSNAEALESRWQRSDIELDQIFTNRNKEFRVIAIADKPTVIIENTETGEWEHHIISSLGFSEFRKKEKI